ncbi:hypothetical protein B0H14DRAFT_3881158 [Mycena olivaceomarginata]|nr:hypothetical protein B0H14DRAFT_3881158 [Mycena olivaceomarginata]
MSVMTHGHARYDSPPTFTPTSSSDHSVTVVRQSCRACSADTVSKGLPVRSSHTDPPRTCGPIAHAEQGRRYWVAWASASRFALIIHISGARTCASLAFAAPPTRPSCTRPSVDFDARAAGTARAVRGLRLLDHLQSVTKIVFGTEAEGFVAHGPFSFSPYTQVDAAFQLPPQTSARTTLLADDASITFAASSCRASVPSVQDINDSPPAHPMIILPLQSPPAPASHDIRPRRAHNKYTAPTHLPASTTPVTDPLPLPLAPARHDTSSIRPTPVEYVRRRVPEPGRVRDASSRPAHIRRRACTSPRFLSGESTPICAILRMRDVCIHGCHSALSLLSPCRASANAVH